ncbi:HAD-IA family hydrolase [Comamonas kerstersii]|uniref:HAD-IA family hydrolase n=1 Tax=Comamonas kerstersii TaxID=225992 RepID=UPI0009845C1B|nr:HAD-IA family hydrolase [Comamonas kerstersii]OOH85496.1 phosphoglycolate phosphatase [Comamonas kerstersii]OOH93918.1 phosphoglycolate phosphatase [Comamonas kerstersii]
MSSQILNADAVLFDLDGTLLDSAPDLGFAANQLRIARGMEPLPQSHYRPFVGTGARGMLRIALGVTPEAPDFELLKEAFFVAYEQCMGQHSALFAQVPQLVAGLQAQGIAWGIVTNKSERFTLPIVQSQPVLAAAHAVVCGDTTAHSKPHPEPLLEAARRAGIAPARCIYVGDDERDMIAARAAGMQAIAAAYGYLGGVDSVTAWKPDFIINSPLELTQLLGLA